MHRALCQLLLLFAALTGCDYAPLQVGDTSDAALPPLTEDEKLAAYGRQLAGSWTGFTTVTTIILTEASAWMNLQWTPNPDSPRSGTLRLRCVTDGVDCKPTAGLPGSVSFGYSLYSVTEDGKVRGALEFKPDGEDVEGITMLELTFLEPNKIAFDAFGGFLITMSGTFDKDPFPPDPPTTTVQTPAR